MTSSKGRGTTPTAHRRRIPWASLVWIALTLILLFVPLVQILGYESAIAINLMVVWIGGPKILGQGAHAPVWTRFWRRCAQLTGWSALSALLLLLNALRVRNCDLGTGLALWGMFAWGGIPPVVALTLFIERFVRTKKAQITLYFSIVGLSAIGSVLWLAWQPPLVVYDAFGGYWAVSIYDEGLAAWQKHLPYRAMTWAGAALWCHALAFEETPRATSAIWAVICAFITSWFALQGGTYDISRSRAYTQELLGGRVETPHFVIFYESAALSERKVQEMIADHEMQYAELREYLGVEPTQKLHSYIYASHDTRHAAMGVRSTMIARVWLGEMHLVWRGFGDDLLRHEMAHLMLREHGRGPLKLASKNGLFPAMGLVEGAASAAAWELDELNDHGWAAAILQSGQMPDVVRMLQASGFWAQSSRVSYTVWSSFSRWLIDTYGAEKFLDAYRDAHFERAYDTSLQDLVEAWTRMLETIELRPAELAAAQMRFERPALMQRMCGRAIATREQDAHRTIAQRAHTRANDAVTWLETHSTHDPYLRFRVARLWTRLNEYAHAETLYKQLLDQEDIGDELSQRIRLALADLAWLRGETDASKAKILEMKTHPLTSAMQRELWVREQLLNSEDSAPLSHLSGRRLLVDSWRYDAVGLRLDLLASALEEKHPAAAWLAFRMGVEDAERLSVPLLEQVLDSVTLPQEVEERYTLDRLAYATRRGDRAACSAIDAMDFSSSTIANAAIDELRVLSARCRVSGRYLDAAQRAME